ncbi:MAG: hypothetical protein M1819_005878 [Sarea resinae]|nr:MAG: hypothetical protein M1819_005878 [Sarea resinae]
MSQRMYTWQPGPVRQATAPVPPKNDGNKEHIYTYKPTKPTATRTVAPPAPRPPPPPPAPASYTYAAAYPYPAYPAYAYMPYQAAYPPQPAAAAAEPPASYQHAWHGASRGQVVEDDVKISARTGANAPHAMAPLDPSPSQQWWCRELDGSYTMRTFDTISHELQPGSWTWAQQGGGGGYPYFVRERPK